MPAPRRRARRQTFEQAHVPAPQGGLNTIDAGSAMPATDCIYIYNLIASEYGLRSRLGYREWCTGLTGAADNTVRSVVPFTGSAQNGSADKLFAVTSTGIWDVTDSSASPSQVLAFASYVVLGMSSTGDAGYGTSTVIATPAGRFLLYCDEVNGLFIYSESSATWAPGVPGDTVAWAALTTYVVGDRVTNGGRVYLCDTAGVSASSGGPTGATADIVDGTARWDYSSDVVANVIGPSLADQRLGYTGRPIDFAAVTVWKNRVWLVERNTSRAWYLGINAIYGEATSFDFGSKMKAGGPLRCLANWSYDGGNGLDTLLVGISGAGDVVIYQGTDPSSANTFGLKGCWFVGAVPAGRRIATDYGGDLLLMSSLGILPLSKLVLGAGAVQEGSLYATHKISNLFNQFTATRRTIQGWALHIHPADNALLVLVPVGGDDSTEQLAMSMSKRSWSRYRDLPIFSGGVWAGDFYFGTADGRVCINTDYVDAVPLAADSSTPVKFSLLTAFQNLGNMRQKRILMVRPTLLSGSTNPVIQSWARYNYNLLEPSEPSGTPTGGWDSGVWDTATWDTDYAPNQALSGATGCGRDVAIAIRGSASSRTIIVGVDLLFEQGGVL